MIRLVARCLTVAVRRWFGAPPPPPVRVALSRCRCGRIMRTAGSAEWCVECDRAGVRA